MGTFCGTVVRSQRKFAATPLAISWQEQAESAVEHRGFMSALPGYSPRSDFILTFIGLVVALYFAAKGFRWETLSRRAEAILQLLNASAFSSS